MKLHVFIAMIFMGLLFSCEKQTSPDEFGDQPIQLQSKEIVKSLFEKSKDWPARQVEKNENATIVEKKFKVRTSGTMRMETCDFDEGFGKSVFMGEGNATHLGKFSIYLDYCFNDLGPVERIYAVQTAANGDELYSMVVGNNPAEQSIDFLITGGTGRFENAYGFITLYFDFDYVNGTFSNYGEGTLAY